MNDRITVGRLFPTNVPPAAVTQNRVNSVTKDTKPFGQVLQEQVLKLSNHAAKRLEQRGIELKSDQMEKINSAVDKAAAKGAKESLILMQDMALIVSVPNRTVVTAMDKQSMEDNVFTQIDSAVIIS
ncbi:TIGR02530 family flagellar biosynthesis protein [Paenibacillus sp. CMAA1739]|uniref:Flagellar biosynthesis protein n=1 Tax=Paenibacillus ottowii TaxID=2315729 RepID=A0ABY3B4R4_9BACL|nr:MULTISPECIES: TIGR02530 family flagellar biosynthesis protein [Paenibacillus]MDP1511001.1 TIGR02530 family flagellar biosynthesis protein [Paenibacillus ottowii]MEC4566502.1 TIGR02530 family flagellar biosynthesis protein [Paenibacillus sp. CMAA1739]OBA01175.1 flagellar biosynthesis protein [Paenibacillus polymyxa]QDY82192.1 flagellar biosynthesis protein [Paenibacillus polymyxa]TQR98867.1 flagellar biosynthesis protein [Paenibacillus ottowii]